MDDKDTILMSLLTGAIGVQIPLWTIRTPGVRFKIVAYAKVQIPLWTIRTRGKLTWANIITGSDSSMDDKDYAPYIQQVFIPLCSDSSMDDKDPCADIVEKNNKI